MSTLINTKAIANECSEKLEKFCSQYGKTNLRYEIGYIWVEIQKEG